MKYKDRVDQIERVMKKKKPEEIDWYGPHTGKQMLSDMFGGIVIALAIPIIVFGIAYLFGGLCR